MVQIHSPRPLSLSSSGSFAPFPHAIWFFIHSTVGNFVDEDNDTIPLLQIAMVLLAFSMEFGAGIAMHEAERVSANLAESHDELRRARELTQSKLSELVSEILCLENEAALFEEKFWCDFWWSVLKRSAGKATKSFISGLLLLMFVSASTAKAEHPLELVVLIDLSSSVGVNGPDSRTEFQKNVTEIGHILRQVPPGAHVTIIGITDDSFAQPYVLMSASVASDSGYFGEKLSAARQRLEVSWRTRSRDLAPSFGRYTCSLMVR